MFEKSHKGGQGMMEEDLDESGVSESYGGGPQVRNWRLEGLDFESEVQETLLKMWSDQGKDSLEKDVQQKRELGVLKALFFNTVPSDPSEPDSTDQTETVGKLVEIPADDLSENRDDSTAD